MISKKDLIALGLTDEQASSVIELEKEDLDGNYVSKSNFDSLNNKKKSAEEKLTQLEQDLANALEIGKSSVSKKDYDEKIKELTSQYESRLASKTKELKLEAFLNGKVYNNEDIINKIDFDKIKIEKNGDVNLSTIESQINAIQEQYPHYFKSNEPQAPVQPQQKTHFDLPQSRIINSELNKPQAPSLGAFLASTTAESREQAQKANEAYFN